VYVEYIGNVQIKKTTDAGVTNTVTIPIDNIINPSPNNNHTLSIRMPIDVTLVTNEELLIIFDISVKKEVPSIGGDVSTLLYFFQNQGDLTYFDRGYWGYSFDNNNPLTGGTKRDENIKRNASGPEPIQLFIDPLMLETRLSHTNGDKPFDVTLSVKNRTDDNISANGIISVVIPRDFIIVD
jgi:hypothetical protein